MIVNKLFSKCSFSHLWLVHVVLHNYSILLFFLTSQNWPFEIHDRLIFAFEIFLDIYVLLFMSIFFSHCYSSLSSSIVVLLFFAKVKSWLSQHIYIYIYIYKVQVIVSIFLWNMITVFATLSLYNGIKHIYLTEADESNGTISSEDDLDHLEYSKNFTLKQTVTKKSISEIIKDKKKQTQLTLQW